MKYIFSIALIPLCLLFVFQPKLFPYLFPLVVAGIVILVVLLFKELYNKYLFYRYFTKNGGKNRAELVKDPCRFHMSIIYLMAEMVRADTSIDREKFNMILRYIDEVCPEEYREKAISVLSALTLSGYDSDEIKKNGGSDYFNGIEDSDKRREISGWRMAEELGNYLNETDRLYLTYLLFSLAAANNSVSYGARSSSTVKTEMEALKDLCVKGLKIPVGMLNELFEEWKAGRIQWWYQNHIASKGDYPTDGSFFDLYSHISKDANIFDIEPAGYKSFEFGYLGLLFIGMYVSSFIILGSLPIMLGDIPIPLFCDDLRMASNVFFLVYVVLGFLIFMPFDDIRLMDANFLHTLLTIKETTVLKRNLILHILFAAIFSLALWFGVMLHSFLMVNNNYIRASVVINRTAKYAGNGIGGGNSECQIAVDPIRTLAICNNHGSDPYVPWLGKVEAEILADVFFIKDFLPSPEATTFYCSASDFEASQSKEVEIPLKVGYYWLPIANGDVVFPETEGEDISSMPVEHREETEDAVPITAQ